MDGYPAGMTWDEVMTLLRGTPPGHLSTVSADGSPHVSKVAFGLDGDRVWLATRRSSAKARNLRANGSLALMAEGNSAETYVWGRAEAVEDRTEIERVWHGGVFPFDLAGFFGSPDNPDVQFFRITPQRAVAMVAGAAGLERRTWTA